MGELCITECLTCSPLSQSSSNRRNISVVVMQSLLVLFTVLCLAQVQTSSQAAIEAVAQSFPPYSYAQGGLDWGGLCASGRSQSPIDLQTAQTESVSDPSFSAISFDIPLQEMPVTDFQIYPLYAASGTLWAVLDEVPFQLNLAELHYHVPAQHLVDGKRYAVELHVSFFIPADNAFGMDEITLVVFFQEGQRNAFIDSLLTGEEVDLYSLLPSPIEDYFYYTGGVEVPVPDCYEGTFYAIPNLVLDISPEQIADMRSGPDATPLADAAGHGLYREVQPLNGRTVYHRVPPVTNSFLS